ncbi:MAG: HAD-IB family phosphatase [Patescibacteria group bacterium]
MKQISKQKPKVIITGIDKMVSYTGSWYKFLQEAGIHTDTHKKVYKELRSGNIDFDEAKKKLHLNLKDKKIHKKQLEKVFREIEVNGDAYSTINDLKKQGFMICIISGSIDLIVKEIAKKFRIKDCYSNARLIFNKEGYWTDIEYDQAEEKLKLKQAKDFMKKNSLKKDDCIVLGHSPADMILFEKFCGITIDCNYTPLKKLACQNVKFFPKILQFLNSV